MYIRKSIMFLNGPEKCGAKIFNTFQLRSPGVTTVFLLLTPATFMSTASMNLFFSLPLDLLPSISILSPTFSLIFLWIISSVKKHKSPIIMEIKFVTDNLLYTPPWEWCWTLCSPQLIASCGAHREQVTWPGLHMLWSGVQAGLTAAAHGGQLEVFQGSVWGKLLHQHCRGTRAGLDSAGEQWGLLWKEMKFSHTQLNSAVLCLLLAILLRFTVPSGLWRINTLTEMWFSL